MKFHILYFLKNVRAHCLSKNNCGNLRWLKSKWNVVLSLFTISVHSFFICLQLSKKFFNRNKFGTVGKIFKSTIFCISFCLWKMKQKWRKTKMKKISFWYKQAMNFIFTSLESWKIGELKNIYFYWEILLLICSWGQSSMDIAFLTI